MSNSKSAISHLRRTGNLDEAVNIVLGKKTLTEAEVSQQSQTWFCPDQDALQQFILRVMDKLPEVSYTTKETNNGSQGGYAVTVSGTYMDHDIAAMGPTKGCSRIDHLPGEL